MYKRQRPWSTTERLVIPAGLDALDLSDVTVLSPARDEASCIVDTLRALSMQGNIARIVLVDDQSSDGTGQVARSVGLTNLTVFALAIDPASPDVLYAGGGSGVFKTTTGAEPR